ncbi:LOW QUALITY PROTEIN: hypothetical protein HZS_4470 [Henneguya salminicola]|nr:LOW QUALITY PROTEIN: hypothetical protein HZS_4470 [Henneguya salminicola]
MTPNMFIENFVMENSEAINLYPHDIYRNLLLKKIRHIIFHRKRRSIQTSRMLVIPCNSILFIVLSTTWLVIKRTARFFFR